MTNEELLEFVNRTEENVKSIIERLSKETAQREQERTARTPTAFNWTPAMSSVFPVRLTMSQLTAMWLALHEAAEYSSIGALTDDPKPFPGASDGWIEWNGGKCPLVKGTPVEVRIGNGSLIKDSALGWFLSADNWNWTVHHPHNPECQIVAYRVLK